MKDKIRDLRLAIRKYFLKMLNFMKVHKKISAIIIFLVIFIIGILIAIKIFEIKEDRTDISSSTHGVIIQEAAFYRVPKEFGLVEIGKLEKGESVYIISTYLDGNGGAWYKVKSETMQKVGYVLKDNVDYYKSDLISDKVLMSDFSKFDLQYENIKDKNDLKVFLVENDINYVYIRAGGRGYGEEGNFYLDSDYQVYIDVCDYLGIPYGFYYINNAMNTEEIEEEVTFMKEFILENATPNYVLPLVIDLEDFAGEGRLDNMWDQRGELIEELVQKFKDANIDTLVYCNANLANKYLAEVDTKFWIAYYNEEQIIPTIWYDETLQAQDANIKFKSNIVAWQFTESGIGDEEEYPVDLSIVKNAYFKQYLK